MIHSALSCLLLPSNPYIWGRFVSFVSDFTLSELFHVLFLTLNELIVYYKGLIKVHKKHIVVV